MKPKVTPKNVGSAIKLAALGFMMLKGGKSSKLIGGALLKRELKKFSR